MKKYEQVFENNRRWVEETRAANPAFFERLSRGQNPAFLYIGCADSRVPANVIMGLEPGDVFVHRNVANLVVNTDVNCQTVIDYAVTYLNIDHIVVCGHYGCGGIAAAMTSDDLGFINSWLLEVRDVYRIHRRELDAITDEAARYRRLVELNVREQCIHVMKTASVQRRLTKSGRPTVHGWVYDVQDGLLRDLKIPVDEILADISDIYQLDFE